MSDEMNLNTSKPRDSLLIIAKHLDAFLNNEMLSTIRYPNILKGDKDAVDEKQKIELFEFKFQIVFRESSTTSAGLLGRSLNIVELNLIKRRVLNFLQNSGFDYYQF